MGNTGVDLSKEKIVQFSVVVNERDKVASRFSEIFGIAWKLYDWSPGNCSIKLAIGDFGGRSLKLIQPVSGKSSYSDFLETNGEGFYSIGFGTLMNHDDVVSALKKAGIAVEMQGDAGGATFSIMNTVEDLGCRIELSGPTSGADNSSLKQTGTLAAREPGIVDLDTPIFSGGKKINQVGLVVKDEKNAARRFEELLGIKGWDYAYGPPNLFNATLDGKPVPDSAMESLDVAFAMGWLGDIQIEIIRPIGIRPGGCHQIFLDKRGNGIQHVSFGIQPDHHEFVKAMRKAGIGVEFSASIKDHGVSATYFASQGQLGGFQLEIVGKTF